MYIYIFFFWQSLPQHKRKKGKREQFNMLLSSKLLFFFPGSRRWAFINIYI